MYPVLLNIKRYILLNVTVIMILIFGHSLINHWNSSHHINISFPPVCQLVSDILLSWQVLQCHYAFSCSFYCYTWVDSNGIGLPSVSQNVVKKTNKKNSNWEAYCSSVKLFTCALICKLEHSTCFTAYMLTQTELWKLLLLGNLFYRVTPLSGAYCGWCL